MGAKRVWEEENERLYDVVFWSRYDVKFLSIPQVLTPEPNTIYVPRVGGYHITPPAEPGIHWGGYSAHLCWMSSAVADILIEMYFSEEDWVRRAVESSAEWGHVPEYMLKFFCDQKGIKAEFVNIEMMLIRGTAENPLSFNYQPLSDYPPY